MPASIYAWLPEEREDEERKQLLEGMHGFRYINIR